MPYKDPIKQREYFREYEKRRDKHVVNARKRISDKKLRQRNGEFYRAYKRWWYRNNREKARAYGRKHEHGLTQAEYLALHEKCGGLCQICGLAPRDKRGALHVDHDHLTGKIRGLLCLHCNSGIGYLRDDPVLLTKALAYLQSNG